MSSSQTGLAGPNLLSNSISRRNAGGPHRKTFFFGYYQGTNRKNNVTFLSV